MKVFENCKWVYHKKSTVSPSKRWGHTANAIGSQIYIFGGKLDQESRKYNQSFYCLNCEDYDFERLEEIKSPQLRDSHMSFVVQNNLYIWGGCINQKVTNECFKFDGKEWKPVEQLGPVPSPRESQISTVIKNRYVLTYGGCTEQQIFDEFNVFDVKKRTWYPLKILGESPPVLENASLTIINNQIYLFGGQSLLSPLQLIGGSKASRNRQIYHNDLYLLELSNYQFQNTNRSPLLTIHRVAPENKPPPERSTHSAIAYLNRYLIILGGETYSKINIQVADLLNDIWYFDLHTNLWKQLKPTSSHLFKKHSTFSAVLHEEEIFVFGGLRSATDCTSSDELLTLRLYDIEDYKIQSVCSICKLVYRNTMACQDSPHDCSDFEPHTETKLIKSNLRTIYKTAQMIGHPFDAFKLIIQGCIVAGSTKIHIDYQLFNGKPMFSIFDNSKRMTKLQFQWIISNNLTLKPQPVYEEATNYSYTKPLSDYAKFLKYGGFKLGRGLFVSHMNGDGEMVSLMSESAMYYYFMKYYQDKNYYELVERPDYRNDYDMVTPFLKMIGEDNSRMKDYTTRRVIFDLQSEEKIRLYKFESTADDILLSRKSQFRINENEESHVESLHSYISSMFLSETPVSISINNPRQPIVFNNQLSFYNEHAHLKISDCNLQSQTGLQFNIYYIPNRNQNEIKIYKSNKILVTRSQRHKRGDYCGYIKVPENWELNLFETGFENDPEFIFDTIDFIIKHHQQQKQDKEPADLMTNC